MYLLALPWKVIFAFTPPPRMMGGWLCFFITLVFIGLLTALIGDLAAHMVGAAPAFERASRLFRMLLPPFSNAAPARPLATPRGLC